MDGSLTVAEYLAVEQVTFLYAGRLITFCIRSNFL